MTPASIVLAIAVAAWGRPIAPSQAPVTAPGTPSPLPTAPAIVEPIAPSPSEQSSAGRPVRPALAAKAPVDVRMRPVLVDQPDRPRPTPLYKRWGFWVVSGGLLVTTVIVTLMATRPKPQPYVGNVSPWVVSLP